MNVGNRRQPCGFLHRLEDSQTCLEPRPAKRVYGRAVSLVIRRLEDKRYTQLTADFLVKTGNIYRELLGLQNIDAPYQNKRLVISKVNSSCGNCLAAHQDCPLTAASMKLENKGCPPRGRDVNSGWNWQATNQGWSASSIISTNPLS